MLIRPALVEDAADIQRVIKQTFDDNVHVNQIARVISSGKHLTYVAQDTPHVVGFVDGFFTRSLNGHSRFEVDLIAVCSTHQGRGIGGLLIGQLRKTIEDVATQTARGLVRVDNIASQALFRRCGFRPGTPQLLFTHQGENTSPPLIVVDTNKAHICLVETLLYTGAWLESLRDETVLADMVHCVPNSQIVGVVISQHDKHIINSLTDNNYQYIGAYHYWISQ